MATLLRIIYLKSEEGQMETGTEVRVGIESLWERRAEEVLLSTLR